MSHSVEHIINLDQPVEQRWEFLANHKEEIDELIACYLSDFEGADFIFESIEGVKEGVVKPEFLEEIKFISTISDFTENEILIANLYYDILKFYFGCSAFAVESNGEIYHARNLDWHTENDLLSKYSAIYRFFQNGKEIYRTVGWYGFIGALSGTKPGKFSLTLNAVLSNDQPEIGTPVSFLIREVLQNCDSFEESKVILESMTIASDCLLLLSGVTKSEMVVIERTPTRFATRKSTENFIAVTNDYKLLKNITSNNENVLQETSCGRFDRVCELLRKQTINSEEECLDILSDEKVKMGITVQQMVFHNNNGSLLLRKTDANTISKIHPQPSSTRKSTH